MAAADAAVATGKGRSNATYPIKGDAAYPSPAWPTAPLARRVAYIHFPKAGSQFVDTLMHYANPRLPADVMGSVPSTQSNYTLHEWFRGIFWEKDGKIGNHHAVSKEVLTYFHGRLFGMFREPKGRSHSFAA